MTKVIIIGAGFSGLSAAAILANKGYQVTVLEKHTIPGGRARQFTSEGFTFDMGPSWYWMPDVFERFFALFGKKVDDYFQLKRLDPSYKIFWGESESLIPADYEEYKKFFESMEKGSSSRLSKFLKEAEFKYDVGINKLVHKPGLSLLEFLEWDVIKGVFKLEVFKSVKSHIAKFFRNPKLRQLLEFPVLFLGALPENTPALYSLMNYADIKLGTWYPNGGMFKVIDSMYRLALEQGVQFKFEHNVTELSFDGSRISGICAIHKSIKEQFQADVVIGSADYHFIETNLLPEKLKSYNKKYWETRKMAPGCLLYFVGLNKKIRGLHHHSLFFDVDFQKHADEIYNDIKWPEDPLFYVSAPSVSDSTVAPEGCENLFFLIPVSSGLEGDTDLLRNRYFEIILQRFEKRIGQNIKDSIIFYKTFGPTDFVNDYNAFKGNAYGLANTLMQTAILKPSCRSKKIKNLFYTGQLTVPGPGVPPSIISGEVVAKQVIKNFKL